MKKNGKKPWLRYAILILFIAGIGYSIYADANKALPVQAATADSGDIQAYVEERARTSLPHIYHVTMPLPGRVMPITVREGDTVTQGQVVATLEDVDWHEAGVSAAEMLVAMKNAVDASAAEIKANQARLDYAEWVRTANKKAMETNAINEKEVRMSEWQYHDAMVKSEEKQANYHAINALYAITKLLPTIVARNLARTQVRSPVAGVILKRHVWNEKTMMPGEALLDIGNLDDLEVTADILTEQAVRIQVDDRVEIFGDAIGNESLGGLVRRVRPEAFTQISSLGVEQQRVAAEIAFQAEDLEQLQAAGKTLGLHYRVRVRIITDEKKQTLRIPRTALFRGQDGNWETFRIENQRAHRVTVTIGLMNDYQAEVLSGLQQNDRVIVAPESTLAEGTKVTIHN
ncbi:efflux RND transporter periplasmic adaptor subunit [Planctomycetota bacterium]